MQAAVDAAERVSGPSFLDAAIPGLSDGAALMITYERTVGDLSVAACVPLLGAV